MRKLTIVYFDAGAGHRNAANAIKAVIEQQNLLWEVDLMNFQEVLDEMDPIKKITRIQTQDVYNRILRSGWTWITHPLLPIWLACVRLYHGQTVRRLTKYWKAHPADFVLSVIPNFNRALVCSVHKASPGVPFATLITDFADIPPHFWMERESEYIICGTEKAVQQAYVLGHPADRVILTSGMVLHPRFYETKEVDVRAERLSLGLKPDITTVLVMFGGQGSKTMSPIAQSLSGCQSALQLILICGHNKKLRTQLKEMNLPVPHFIEGFTKRMDYYMQISDVFVGKPGPGSISEALHFHLPVVVERNRKTMPQEKYNAEWVEKRGVGISLNDFRQIGPTIDNALQSGKFEQVRQNARNIRNRAIFEVPEILERIWSSSGRAAELQGQSDYANTGSGISSNKSTPPA